jgi:adenylate cyclase
MIELERTYLAKELPAGLKDCPSKEMIDIYVPASAPHPDLRIRKSGSSHVITRKRPVVEGDSSRMLEETIELSADEFSELNVVPGKRVEKKRYFYEQDGHTFEIDVFTGALSGLVLVDIEFDTVEEKDSFGMPSFCLVEVTQEKFIAGGMLCGKSYADIEDRLTKFGYKKLAL